MKNRIVLFLAIFFGSLCVGLFSILLFVNATQVDCVKQGDGSYTCHLRTLILGQVPAFGSEIQNVVGIQVVEDDSGDGISYRAEFSTTDGKSIPLDSTWTDYNPVSQQVSAIGSQMDSGADHVSYTVEPSWWVLFLIGGLTLTSMLFSPLAFLKK